MADKGFAVQDLLSLGVSLNIPPFLGSKGQMTPEEVVQTQQIGSLRIHVERAINKIKNFHIWDSVVPFTLFSVFIKCGVCVCVCFYVQFSKLHHKHIDTANDFFLISTNLLYIVCSHS